MLGMLIRLFIVLLIIRLFLAYIKSGVNTIIMQYTWMAPTLQSALEWEW